MQPHQLLVAQEPEACHAQDRIEEILQMVQGAHEAQRGQEIALSFQLRASRKPSWAFRIFL